MKITIDASDMERLYRQLEKIKKESIPYAVRSSLNQTAFMAREIWQKKISRSMQLRNAYTLRSIRVDKAQGTNVSTMQSFVGSVVPYMAVQETGATLQKGHKYGVTIPTGTASGEGRIRSKRLRLVRAPNKLPAISLTARPATGSRKQRNAVAISQAVRSGNKYVFLELDHSKGIFKISGGKRKPKLDMIWDISRSSVRLKSNPTLEQTLPIVNKLAPAIHMKAIEDQIARQRVQGI